MARYLITGASGFLGRHLGQQLQAQGHQVLAQVEDLGRWRAWPWAVASGATPLPLPLAQADRWQADGAFVGDHDRIDGIFHLAGIVHHSRLPHPSLWPVNVDATLAMVRLAHRLGVRLVWASTSGTVGCSMNPADAPDEQAPHAEAMVTGWPYYHSKVQAERRAGALARQLGGQLVVLRPPVMLGPEDHRLRSTQVVANFLAGQPPVVPTGSMHFTDVRDVAAAAIRAMRVDRAQAVYHLPGHAMPLRTFFGRIGQLCGRRPPRWVVGSRVLVGLKRLDARLAGTVGQPGWLRLPDEVVLEMGACHWGLGSRHAAGLGFRARPAEQTLTDTVAWLRHHHPRCQRPRPRAAAAAAG